MGVDTTQRMVASALFQPIYSPDANVTADVNTLLPRQLSIISDGSEENISSRELIRQASNLSSMSDIEVNDDKVTQARNKIIFKAPRPSLLMMTPNTAYKKMRRSYVFTGANLSRSLLISVNIHQSNRMKVSL